ncbi:hypothetical protein DKY63_04190 [Pseudomonas putida]|uniref:TnsA endonuclease N-terminal domain-containing protein n=1 Tax=Pseudomonas putida TaxID=303 RepID=A0A2Z4RDY1_PSEPU|nr:hypothetical protein [Pseudomonas putida]AWY39147.1 hypothetical protein DKY63_04190 [Pseudomonas putida]
MELKGGEVKLLVEKTVQMRARDSLYMRYRRRGQKKSNLWVVYSPKSRQDIILHSDLELIYWLHFVESEARVKSFSVCDIKVKTDPNFLLEFTDGQHRADYLRRSPGVAENNALVWYDNTQWVAKFIDVMELATVAKQALRWLKPIAYAAAIRDQELTTLHNALIMEEWKCSGGTVKYLIDQLSNFDQNHVIGMLMRHFIEGRLSFDLSDASFGGNTRWAITGKQDEQNQ